MREETAWPGGRKVAALVTVALELWSPGHRPAYAPMAAAWPLSGVDDTHSTSWVDYGVTTRPVRPGRAVSPWKPGRHWGTWRTWRS
ncbi:hypothetical protein ABR738_02830 [Streptomyces sp. Edi4]|uniref:hypothetical protein n=1 Tax=Streptomyces sp. Edi4 TaxID=3162527 RepID=UPI0033062C3B